MSAHARVVYMALKARYSFKARNNGRLYLSVRQAAKETGFNKDMGARCLRELAYYGFIVMTNPGCLGVDGKGKAPHWRLTELGYMTDPPTKGLPEVGRRHIPRAKEAQLLHSQAPHGPSNRRGDGNSRYVRHVQTGWGGCMSDTYRRFAGGVSDTYRHSYVRHVQTGCPTRTDGILF
jgi:hypothetical protein